MKNACMIQGAVATLLYMQYMQYMTKQSLGVCI